LASLAFFGLIDAYCPKWHGIEMVGLAHSIISVLITVFAFVEDVAFSQGFPKFCAGEGGHSVLSMILPMISAGYAVFDVMVGLRSNRIDYFLHGVVLFGIMGVSCMYGMSHHLTYSLTMECSTVFLNLRVLKKNWIDIAFVVSFVVTRILLVPYLWWIWLKAYDNADETTRECIAGSEVLYYCVVFAGIFFNALNLYWGQIIVRRLAAKIQSGNALLSKEWKPEPGQNMENINDNPEPFKKKI
jgi:hypothetical protein